MTKKPFRLLFTLLAFSLAPLIPKTLAAPAPELVKDIFGRDDQRGARAEERADGDAFAGDGESFTLGSAVGNANSLAKVGDGSTRLALANSFTGAAGALGATASVAVNAGGTLLLSGTGDRINNSAAMALAGGIFKTDGLSETRGALTLSASSTIDFGTAGSASALIFSPGAGSWTGTLSVDNWSSGVDQLFVGSDASGLNPSQLSQISFFSGIDTVFLGAGGILSTGRSCRCPNRQVFFWCSV